MEDEFGPNQKVMTRSSMPAIPLDVHKQGFVKKMDSATMHPEPRHGIQRCQYSLTKAGGTHRKP